MRIEDVQVAFPTDSRRNPTTGSLILAYPIATHCTEPRGARGWMQILSSYREPNHARSIVEIVITLGPLAALWSLAWAVYHFGFWWLSLLLSLPAAASI
jgi:fatty acid desaturase